MVGSYDSGFPLSTELPLSSQDLPTRFSSLTQKECIAFTFYTGASVVNSNSFYSRFETRFPSYTAFDYR